MDEEDPRVAYCRTVAEGGGYFKPSHDLGHVHRVVALARRIARAEGADEALTVCAAYLHDVDRGREDAGGPDHAEAGASTARGLLEGVEAFSPEDVERIVAAIASHRFRSGPSPGSPEARALFDADKLDALGAVGVGRAYMMAREHGQLLHSRPDPDAVPRHVRDIDHSEYSPVEEYEVKLRHLRDIMTTEEGRRMARTRAAFMDEFFRVLEEEVQGLR